MNIAIAAFISQSTFYSIQKKLLYPAIHRVYTTNRALLLESASEIHLLGDGRCESPGCNAKCAVGVGQAKIQSGKLRFKQQYSKVTHLWVVKQIRGPKDRLYIQHLMDKVMLIQNSNEKYELPKLENIPKTIAQIEKPNKEAIKNIRTCFSV